MRRHMERLIRQTRALGARVANLARLMAAAYDDARAEHDRRAQDTLERALAAHAGPTLAERLAEREAPIVARAGQLATMHGAAWEELARMAAGAAHTDARVEWRTPYARGSWHVSDMAPVPATGEPVDVSCRVHDTGAPWAPWRDPSDPHAWHDLPAAPDMDGGMWVWPDGSPVIPTPGTDTGMRNREPDARIGTGSAMRVSEPGSSSGSGTQPANPAQPSQPATSPNPTEAHTKGTTMSQSSQQKTIRVNGEKWRTACAIAALRGEKINQVISEALTDYIEEHPDFAAVAATTIPVKVVEP